MPTNARGPAWHIYRLREAQDPSQKCPHRNLLRFRLQFAQWRSFQALTAFVTVCLTNGCSSLCWPTGADVMFLMCGSRFRAVSIHYHKPSCVQRHLPFSSFSPGRSALLVSPTLALKLFQSLSHLSCSYLDIFCPSSPLLLVLQINECISTIFAYCTIGAAIALPAP